MVMHSERCAYYNSCLTLCSIPTKQGDSSVQATSICNVGLSYMILFSHLIVSQHLWWWVLCRFHLSRRIQPFCSHYTFTKARSTYLSCLNELSSWSLGISIHARNTSRK